MVNYLNNGGTLILDRYSYSGVAYSCAKGGDMEECKDPDRGLPEPDIIFYMDIDPSRVMKRTGFGEELHDSLQFQIRVKSCFEKLFEQELSSETCIIIDSNQEEKSIHQLLSQIVLELLKKPRIPLQFTLWKKETTTDQ